MMFSIELIKQALTLEGFDVFAAQRRMAPLPRPAVRPRDKVGQPRIGGVLVLLYQYQNQLSLLLTRRRDDLSSHAGQISFPGGKLEQGETPLSAALREAHEEVGVHPSMVSLLGGLSQIYIPPSDFEVHPFVAYCAEGKRPSFVAAEYEVAELIDVPLALLLDDANRREEPWQFRGDTIQVPFFDVYGHKVWGATAIMLSEFVERLRFVNRNP